MDDDDRRGGTMSVGQLTDQLPEHHNRVHVIWTGERHFEAGRPGGPLIPIDSAGVTGPSPVDALLIALAGCTGVDIVEILTKRRTPPARFRTEVLGRRVSGVPRRLEWIRLEFEIDGADVERVHAERAAELSVTKYCSVRDSIAPDIAVEFLVTLNGERGEVHRAPPPARLA